MSRYRALTALTAALMTGAAAGAAAVAYWHGRAPEVVRCEMTVPPAPPGYPGHNPQALSARLVYPAAGACPDVSATWNPYEGRTACRWRVDMRRWECP